MSDRRWAILVTLLGVLAAACAPTAAPAPATATLAPATPAPTPAAPAPTVGAALLADPSSPVAGPPTPPLALVLTISGSPGPFDRPNAVAVDRQGRIYVGEMSPGHAVQVFDGGGAFLRKWGGQGGRGDGQFNYITGLAVDADGNVLAAEFENGRVQKFDPDGRFPVQFGGPGTGDGQFRARNGPYGLAVDRQGNVYALDLDGTLQKFDPAGRFVAKWAGTGGSRMMAVDEHGDLYIRTRGARAIKKYRQP